MANWKFWEEDSRTTENFKEIGKDIVKGVKWIGSKGTELGKGAGAAVIEKVFGGGTVEDIKNKKFKGIAKGGIVLGAMITVGILAGPIGWLGAAVLAIGAGAAVPKVASLFGVKGFEKSADKRQQERLELLKSPEKLQAKKKEFEKSASWKKKLGIGAIGAGILATILSGGAAWPLILVGLAVGAPAAYFSSKDSKKADALKDINDKSNEQQIKEAALAAGLVKPGDIKPVVQPQVDQQQNQVQPQVQAQNQQDQNQQVQDQNQQEKGVIDTNILEQAQNIAKKAEVISEGDLTQSVQNQVKIQQNNDHGIGK